MHSFGRTTAENKHLMVLLCKWVDCVYSVGPVNAELDIVTLHDSRASGNLLIWFCYGTRGGGLLHNGQLHYLM